MADETLLLNGDAITNLYILLGANAAYCFEDTTLYFGSLSVFSQTQFEVMLIGNISQLITDLTHLPFSPEIGNLHICDPNVTNHNHVDTSVLAVNCLAFSLSS